MDTRKNIYSSNPWESKALRAIIKRLLISFDDGEVSKHEFLNEVSFVYDECENVKIERFLWPVGPSL